MAIAGSFSKLGNSMRVDAAIVAIYGGIIINAITHASGDNGCFRIRYPAWAFYDDHSGFCHNN